MLGSPGDKSGFTDGRLQRKANQVWNDFAGNSVYLNNGFSLQRGFTTVNPFDADVKQAMISRADHVIILADSTKAGKVRSYPVSGLGQGHHLISDSGLSDEYRLGLEKAGIRVEIVAGS
jgi:DeoR/GlpR family transcriptional regulator of sugar metabolism